MKKSTQVLLICIGLLDIITAIFIANHFAPGKEVLLTVIPGILLFNFFMYKLLAGWLIVNMTVKIVGTRKSTNNSDEDHLALEIILTKGNIDSIWLDRIEIQLKEIDEKNEIVSCLNPILIPHNFCKRGEIDDNYWIGTPSPFYTISSGEETTFSAYTTVRAGRIILAELLVLGTRLFYGIESQKEKRIQWRSSVIILPSEKKQ